MKYFSDMLKKIENVFVKFRENVIYDACNFPSHFSY